MCLVILVVICRRARLPLTARRARPKINRKLQTGFQVALSHFVDRISKNGLYFPLLPSRKTLCLAGKAGQPSATGLGCLCISQYFQCVYASMTHQCTRCDFFLSIVRVLSGKRVAYTRGKDLRVTFRPLSVQKRGGGVGELQQGAVQVKRGLGCLENFANYVFDSQINEVEICLT